jgi:prepilin-type N-terminal cleavage/methylation domain-containing protein
MRVMRAFSLVEVMIVVAVLGVVAALAVPNILPQVHMAQLQGASEGYANFIARVRAEAMTSKRCTRVIINGNTLEGWRFNTYDCDVEPDPTTTPGPYIDATAGAVVLFDKFTPESPNVTIALADAPAEPNNGSEVRFRQNGRVFGKAEPAPPTPKLDDDDALFKVGHSKLAAAQFFDVLVQGNGLVCVFKRGQVPAGPPYSCP